MILDDVPLSELKSFTDSTVSYSTHRSMTSSYRLAFFQLQSPATQLPVANSIIILYLGADHDT